MDIAAWLRALGLERYVEAFQANDIDAAILRTLNAEDLKELGVTSLGHRKTLLEAIAALTPQSSAAPDVPTQAPATPTARQEAERRQLTVMFVDLVASTELAARLDPEDMGGVIRAYQDCCAEVVERWDGHVAKFMGDGILAYFGWPRAHEDDAERALRCGLGLVHAVSGVKTPAGDPLAARVGIATGPVVVGDLIGEGAAQEEAVVGETPNLAARLQALAAPGSVVISQATRRLVGGLFELVDLGPRRLKGFAAPLSVFRVEGEGRAEGRFEALHGEHLTPLVGREHEIGLLVDRWERAKEGEGQVVLLSGEPGIGKSRIVRALRERLAGEPFVPLSHYCSPYHTNTALYPVIGLLERAAGFTRGEAPEARLTKLEAVLARGTEALTEAVPLVAALLGIETGQRYPDLALSPQRQKQRTLEALLDQLAGLAAKQPVLAVYEDVHWVDPTTLELLDLIVERVQRLPVLVLITFRLEFSPPWVGQAQVTLLPLNRLGRRQGAAIVERLTGGKVLPDEVLYQIVAKTDGVPLFVEELTKTVLESGVLRDAGDRYEVAGQLPPLAIPATLHDSLMARLDRLAPAKQVAQIGAVIGRGFGHDLVAAVAQLPESQLAAALDQLVQAELVFRRGTPPDAIYTFKHALVQETAYQSLLKSRRQLLHARIADVLERSFPETIEGAPELLARHCGGAGLTERAIDYWQKASQRAVRRAATTEAVAHIEAAIELLPGLRDETTRKRLEISLQLALGAASINAKGIGSKEVEAAYLRAHDLSHEIGDVDEQFTALWGLWRLQTARGELLRSRERADRLMALAERQQRPAILLEGHHAKWSDHFFRGELLESRAHAERGIRLYDRQAHGALGLVYGGHDPAECCYTLGALALWMLGFADQARDWNGKAIAIAKELADPQTLAHAHYWGSMLPQMLGEVETVRQRAEISRAIAEERGFANFLAEAGIFRGWALATGGAHAEGIVLMQAGLAARETAVGGAVYIQPYHYSLLADAYSRDGRRAEARAALEGALAQVAATEERWYEAELLRCRGELLRHEGCLTEAQVCFVKAIEIGRRQSARSWELRAATSLARLWAEQGERQKAHDLLAPVYGWFTEGFDTQDLKDAGALVDALG